MAATLYRCKTPTDRLCPCGRVARGLRRVGVDFDEVRVRTLKRHRPEVEELTGQRWVPVLVHGDDVIHDSRRILEYLERLERRSTSDGAGGDGSDDDMLGAGVAGEGR